jgi:sn-glycerol 3-phosphate transport system permease protein
VTDAFGQAVHGLDRGAAKPPPYQSAAIAAVTHLARPNGTRFRMTAHIHGWLLLLPAAVLLVTFTHYPAVATIIDSFFSTPRGQQTAAFVGLDNYQAMLDDPVFWRALGNNIVYTASVVPLTVALALLMAIWINGKISGRPFLRMSFFTPTVLPMIAVANIWLFFYSPGYGLIDQVFGLFGFTTHNWLGNEHTALACLIVVAIWKDAGFFMIFYLAALQQMSPQLAEAAALEGASRWYFFRRVTFPLLAPTTLFVLINAIINSFRLIDHIVVMTRGGPDNSTALLLFYIYEAGFKFWDTAYAATLTVVLLALLAVLAIGQFVFLDRRIHYQ